MFKNKRGASFNAVAWERASLIALCVVLTVVLVGLIFATTYVNYLLGLVNRVDGNIDETLSSEQMETATESLDPNYTGPVENPEEVTLSTIPSDFGELDGNSDGIINILLVGQDRRDGEPRQRSDSMILCTFDTIDGDVTMTSFLRDTYVYIPGHGNRKLNAAYQYGGFALLDETLMVNFGVDVDANVEVDFDGFIGIIDLIGGVDIYLSKNEANYMNKYKGFEYNKNEWWNLKEGVNHLNADQALAYARIRKTSTSTGTRDDWGRTERQRTVLMAIIDAYKNQSLANMLALVDDVLPLITTDMTNSEIMTYVVRLFPMLANAEFKTQHIPGHGYYTSKYFDRIGSSLVPDLEKIRELLAETLYNNEE